MNHGNFARLLVIAKGFNVHILLYDTSFGTSPLMEAVDYL